MLREMSTTNGQSPGGYLWAILEPAAGIAFLTAIFSLGFRAPPLGTNFAYFYAGGILPLLTFNDVSSKLSQTFKFSRGLLEYPRVTFADALLARLFLATLTQIMVYYVVLSTILLFTETHTSMDFGIVIEAFGLVMVFSTGVGILNGFLMTAFPLWQTIWTVATRPLMLVSCIFFLLESVPQPYQGYLWYNPLSHVTGMMRDGFYPFYNPTYPSALYVFICGALPGLVGLLLLRRYHREMLDR
ncbi:MAG: ABC transporter permease [Paracoccaceae bacterium]